MNKIIPFFLIAIGLFFFSACKKDKRLPLVATSAVQAGIVNAQIAGVLYEEGDSRVTEKGICWSSQGNVSIGNNKVICTDQGSAFTAAISGLEDNKTYYARAYAINSLGVSYGREISFETQSGDLPDMTLFMSPSQPPGPASADVRIFLEQRFNATYTTGICWSMTPTPTVLSNTMMVVQITPSAPSYFTQNYYATLQNLNESTLYYVRAFSTNGVTTSYSNQLSFTTEHFLDISSLNSLSFTNASITSTISSTAGTNITAVGVCWGLSPYPTIADSKSEQTYLGTSFTRTLTPLTAGTTYYVRSYIKKSGLTYYSPQKKINTFKSTVTDIDGNSYNTVQIGSQEWMVSNLRTTRYNTGATIQLVSSYNQWVNLTNAQTPVYSYYNYQSSYNTTYGKLYPRYVAFDPNIAPVGWHVATLSEWQTLFANYLTADVWNNPGYSSYDGNYTGLSLSAGGRWEGGPANQGSDGFFWAPPSLTQNNSMDVRASGNYPNVGSNSSGYSIRCIKN